CLPRRTSRRRKRRVHRRGSANMASSERRAAARPREVNMPGPALERLFEEHAAASLDKQLRLQEVVGEDDWSLDVPSGILSFGGPYAGGAAFMLRAAPPVRHLASNSTLRVTSVFSQFVMAFTCNARAAFQAYARHKGFQCAATETGFECLSPDGDRLVADFDD